MSDDPELEAHFAALRDRFREGLASYRERLVEARNGLASGVDTVPALKRAAHELAGSAGAFGFEEIGAMAAALEQAADQVLAGTADPIIVMGELRPLLREIELSL
jgi:HPt (histidine-containing phosphotransfer) domain-containing protein